jgi:carboxyl-terminal processing protease
MRRALFTLVLAVATAGSFLLGSTLTGGRGGSGDAAAADAVAEVRERLVARYYKPVPARLLRLKRIESILAGLNDPYTEYLEPFAYSELRRRTAATYSGIGATLLPQRDGFVVSAVPPGPAYASGLRAGDTIVTIGGTPARRLSFEAALTAILGKPGTTVRLGVRREGRPLRFDIRRGEIKTSAVTSLVLEAEGRRVGYVALRSLAGGTAQLLHRELERLQQHGVTRLVLDLRDNPGGLLDQAVAVCSLFLARGRVVSIVSAHERPQVLVVDGRESTSALPLAVLVNRYTASAAEVVAAALQDNGRAVLVGQSTFGKALVQSIEPLRNGAALKLTTARYFTPAGRDISDRGLTPEEYALDDPSTRPDEGLEAALREVVS